MTIVQKIQQDVRQLPQPEFLELFSWMAQYDHEQWDKQIEEDLKTGRLDRVMKQAMQEIKQGHTQPL